MADTTTTTTDTTPPPAPTVTDWTSGFTDETKGFIANKGFKGPQDVIESYRNLEKLRGVPEDRLLKLPESMDAPEARAVWEKLGAPKEAKGYELEMPKESDPKYGEYLATMFHEIGVPKDMARKIVSKQLEYGKLTLEANAEAQKHALAQADTALKKEWGMAYDQNRQLVDMAARNLGLSTDEVAAMGTSLGMDKSMKLLHRLGTSLGEHSFVTGGAPNSGLMSPNQARDRIAELRSDRSFTDKLLKGDVEAKKKWEQAHKMASPGEISI